MNPYLLEIKDICKKYPGVIANNNVSFNIREGKIHALLGENGAGKSTLVKILYGLVTPDSGKIIQVNPAGTTLIQLPAAADNAGFYCTVVITEDDGGAMDQIVNIGTLAGEFFNGIIFGADGGGGLVANGTSNDFVNCKATATSGERFEIFSDGTRMHITGFCFDASDTVFADTAAS